MEEIDVGDTVRVKNKTDKHKASEMYIVTSKDDNSQKVGVQKLLHPLENTKAKIMSKVFKTDRKHLTTIHKPDFPDESEEEDTEEIEVKKKFNNSLHSSAIWNPINRKFFEDSSDDEECDRTENLHEEDDEDRNSNASSSNNDRLEWDSSPEQLELQMPPSDDDQLQVALQPRQLFVETGDVDDDEEHEDDSLTEGTTDDEVFVADEFKTPPSAPMRRKLKRRNAIRRPKRQTESEPRVTRRMLHTDRYSLSNPTSPSVVNLSAAQNLENILLPRIPIVPEAVNMEPGAVQRLDEAYENDRTRRQSARNQNKPKIDYKKMNNPWKK